MVESRDISIFAVDEISSNGKLLPKGPERQAVVDLVDLHFKVSQYYYYNQYISLEIHDSYLHHLGL